LRQSYQLTLDGLRVAGNTKGARAVERIGAHLERLTPNEATQLHQWALKASPAVPNMITDIILPSMLASPDHTLRDLAALARGMRYSDDQLFQELMMIDLRALGMRFELPFFVFQGDSDVLTPTATARAYFEEVTAPHKEFVLIERCGHLAAFARPDQFLAELRTRVRPLVVAESHALR
jgi:pimeloyl-ACP methyl ester carboxylesterase